jgi:hypothetical protein
MTLLRAFPADADLLNDVVRFSVEAVQDYLEMSGDASIWQAPERWIQSEVARKLKQRLGIFIWLEPGMDKVLEWVRDPQVLIVPALADARTTGFLDLALFEPHDPVDQSDFRGIVELKTMVNTGSEFNADANRIRYIGSHCRSGLCGIVAGIYAGDAARLVQQMKRSLSLSDSDIRWQQSSGPCPISRSPYGAIGALVLRSTGSAP